MDIKKFVSSFRNHPVMFVGTGLSLRYLENSFSWDALLERIACEVDPNNEYYLDLKAQSMTGEKVCFEKVAGKLESDFNEVLQKDRNGKHKDINDLFYENMKNNINISRFKLYISQLLHELSFRSSMASEISELKKARKNIGSVITTNYDQMIESIFGFSPLVGNDILLSNPYGSVYKIHGCVTKPERIIITDADYSVFSQKYELIRAQLLSLFIHNPIIFIGYSIGDQNIKDILKTIFTYVDSSSPEAKKIRDNFLLVEYESDSDSHEVYEHDIDIEGFPTIRINKLSTDDFSALFQALAGLKLPVSAMDVRKVQTVVHEIYAGGSIKVNVVSDLDMLSNSDKVLVIGKIDKVKYEFQTASEIMANYFQIIEESNAQILKPLNKQVISKRDYFPIFGLAKIYGGIDKEADLKKQQTKKMEDLVNRVKGKCKGSYSTVNDVLTELSSNADYKREDEISLSILNGVMDLTSAEEYLMSYPDKRCTGYRKMLCAYDYMKYR